MSEAFDTHTYRALDYLARVINNAVNLAGKTWGLAYRGFTPPPPTSTRFDACPIALYGVEIIFYLFNA